MEHSEELAIVRDAITQITELIPDELVDIALSVASTELYVECARRDLQMLAMYATGRSMDQIAAYRDATADIRDLADRWDHEVARRSGGASE